MPDYNDIKIGDAAELRHTITQRDLDRFVDITGDNNKLHVDRDYASKTVFKKPVVHGMLGASFISTVIGTRLPGDGALWFSQNLEFLLPVRIGDEITVKAEVIKKYDRERVIEIRTDIYNQNQQKVTSGTAKVKIVEQEVPERKPDAKTAKTALIVGGTGGIGKATCLALAREGYDVLVHYHRNEEAAREIRQEVENLGRKAIIWKADITDESQVRDLALELDRTFGALTVLANCTTHRIVNLKFLQTEWSHFQNHIDVAVKGAYFLIKHTLPLMERQSYGKIIHITTQAIETPTAEWLPYITAKAGLHGFSKALALELAPKGIRVNMISPGMTDTELIADIPEKLRLLAAARTPLKRLATPEDIADAVCFLASDKSDFMTGETLRINGGQVMI